MKLLVSIAVLKFAEHRRSASTIAGRITPRSDAITREPSTSKPIALASPSNASTNRAAEYSPRSKCAHVVVWVRRVDAADRVERQANLGLIAVERLEGTRQDHPAEVEEHGSNHRRSVPTWLTGLHAERTAVVDGSNIATEGRSEPSLQQLDEAVTQFIAEYDFERVTVIVDASFEHRVAKSERQAARQAIDDNEIITPPAASSAAATPSFCRSPTERTQSC